MEKEYKQCPCGSKSSYKECCQPLHEGALAPNPTALMRSRYSAYALNLPKYIIATTHPASPHYNEDQKNWTRQLAEFSLNSKFLGVDILSSHENEKVGVVLFRARLMQRKQDITFIEKSFFEKWKGKWLYRNGMLQEGHAPSLMTSVMSRSLPLSYYGNPILRRKAESILEITDEIRELVQAMTETMDIHDGVGIAAPQVHYSLRLFIIREPIVSKEGHIELGPVKVFINPVLVGASATTCKMNEGCLSIPTIHAVVERPSEIDLEYTDLTGKRIKAHFSGEEARFIQHEYDHIEGVLFIDRLSEAERVRLEPFLERINRRIHDGTEL